MAQMLPPGIPASELRLIAKGKTASREDRLGDGGTEMFLGPEPWGFGA